MDKNQNTKNFLWNIIGTGINSVMSFVFVIMVTRINDIETSGMFSVCLSVSFILFAVSNLGNRIFEVSDLDSSDSLYFTLKIFSCSFTLIVALLISFLMKYDLVKTLVVISITLVRCIEAFSDTFYAVLQKNERLDLVGISYTLKNVAVIVLFAAVDIITGNILLASLAMIIATLLVCIFFDLRLSRRYCKVGPCSLNGIGTLIKGISFFFFFNLIMIVLSNVPRLLADTKYSSEEMGFFAIIMMIPTVMVLIGQFIIQPYLNRLILCFNSGELNRFNKIATVMLAFLTGCAAICSIAAYFIGPPILGIIMGVDLKGYALTMVIAIIAGTFNVFTTLISNFLTVMKRTAKQLLLYVITLVLEIVLVYIGVQSGNINNVFIGYLATMIIQFLLFAVYYLISLKSEKAKLN